MKLIFVRHGHTNFNRWGIMNDDPTVDVHLTKLGKKQARSAAEKLKDVKIDHIYCSMLPRTFETATIINQYHDLNIERDARINDNRTGFNGLPWFFNWISFKLAKNAHFNRFNGGESLEDSRKRVFNFLDEKKMKHPNETVLVVGHSNTGQIINGYKDETPTESMFKGRIVNGFPVEYDL